MSVFYQVCRVIMTGVMPLWCKITCEGRENLPEAGGCLYISNHRSMADPIFIGIQNPQAQFCVLAKEEAFKYAPIAWLLRKLGGVPIERGSGNMEPLKELEERLQNGENALVFPEGTRSSDGTLGRFKLGAAVIAAQSGVPIVPVGISFEGKLHFRSHVTVRYGKPYHLPSGVGENPTMPQLKEIRREMTAQVQALLIPPKEEPLALPDSAQTSEAHETHDDEPHATRADEPHETRTAREENEGGNGKMKEREEEPEREISEDPTVEISVPPQPDEEDRGEQREDMAHTKVFSAVKDTGGETASGEAVSEDERKPERSSDTMTTNRRIDWGKFAFILSMLFILVFVIDFFSRLWIDHKAASGELDLVDSSSQVQSLSDLSSQVEPEESAAGTPAESSASESSQTSESGEGSSSGDITPLPSEGAQTVSVLSESIHTGSLLLIDASHPLSGTPDCTAFKDFTYAHLRLPSTALEVNNMTTDAISSMFNDFFAATSVGNVLVYVTTAEPATAAYGTGIAERASGLSLDLGVLDEATGSHTAFTGEGTYSWIPQHAADYGYVVRYPAGKEDKTGQTALPSHYRFVGVPHASYMAQQNLCLEEYLELVREHTWDGEHLTYAAAGSNYEVYYVPADTAAEATEVPYPAGTEPQISGDNVGGFIVTVKQN